MSPEQRWQELDSGRIFSPSASSATSCSPANAFKAESAIASAEADARGGRAMHEVDPAIPLVRRHNRQCLAVM